MGGGCCKLDIFQKYAHGSGSYKLEVGHFGPEYNHSRIGSAAATHISSLGAVEQTMTKEEELALQEAKLPCKLRCNLNPSCVPKFPATKKVVPLGVIHLCKNFGLCCSSTIIFDMSGKEGYWVNKFHSWHLLTALTPLECQ